VISVYTLGLDIGSATSKCVVLCDGSSVAGEAVISVGTGTSGPDRALEAALKSAGLAANEIASSAVTGYGRNSWKGADFVYTELSCHARGANMLYPEVRTVLDIGGQDAKALGVLPGGRLGAFVMNDKCAAGTGRFLEVMARILEMDLSELGAVGLTSVKPAEISSTCTVFAESEVISQLSKGISVIDLAAGINRSVAVRGASLVKRLGVAEPVFMTGGVARNPGVVRALEEILGLKIQTHRLSQLAGALGAACIAHEQMRRKETSR
jgi:predicted CoA-substrate-specific enzyme activase